MSILEEPVCEEQTKKIVRGLSYFVEVKSSIAMNEGKYYDEELFAASENLGNNIKDLSSCILKTASSQEKEKRESREKAEKEGYYG